METCTFADIEAEVDATVSAVAHDQGIDPVCSTSNWTVPVASAFSSRAKQRVFTSRNGHVMLLDHETPNGSVLSGFDAVWGFATPLVGSDPTALVNDFVHVLRHLDFYVVSLSGLDPTGPLFDEVMGLNPAGFTDSADRCVADLADGFDAWIGRRSPRFRRSLRAAVSRGEAAGMTIEHQSPDSPAQVEAAFQRLLTIEATSWKTDAESGLVDTSLGVFTRAMCERFAARQSLVVQFAQLDGRDIGYVIGGRVNGRYRGFQHSFDQNYPELSIGKFLQYHAISMLAEHGIDTYDMGMHMPYKESYVDRIESTVTAIIPHPLAVSRQ